MLHQSYGVDLMDIAAGGHLDQQTVSWLGERSEHMFNNVSSMASNFFNQAREVYQMISSSDAVQALRNLTVKTDNVWATNNIHACFTIEHLQTANPVMQRYIMANPNVRDMYLNNTVEGYAGSYENLHGNNIGERHYDYRRVMDEVVIVHDTHIEYNHYYEEIPEGDKELTLYEKVDILKTWNLVNQALDAHEMDPTSPVGNLL